MPNDNSPKARTITGNIMEAVRPASKLFRVPDTSRLERALKIDPESVEKRQEIRDKDRAKTPSPNDEAQQLLEKHLQYKRSQRRRAFAGSNAK